MGKPDAGSGGQEVSQGAITDASLACLACFSKYIPHARMIVAKNTTTTPNQNGGLDPKRSDGRALLRIVLSLLMASCQEQPAARQCCFWAVSHKPAARLCRMPAQAKG